MTAIKNEKYRPHRNGFPFKLLKYLFENGETSGVVLQDKIGLNQWADKKGEIYYDRASSNFDGIIYQLRNKGLIKILENDNYKLTKNGNEFMSSYSRR